MKSTDYPHILLNIGNMRFMFEQGNLYNTTSDPKYLEAI